jgi:hypothetical protein
VAQAMRLNSIKMQGRSFANCYDFSKEFRTNNAIKSDWVVSKIASIFVIKIVKLGLLLEAL